MKIGLELSTFMKKNNVSPTSTFGLPFAQVSEKMKDLVIEMTFLIIC